MGLENPRDIGMSTIEQAREFVLSEVIEPALAHPDLPKEIANKVRNSGQWVNHFKRIGDLTRYLERFWNRDATAQDDLMVKTLTSLGLRTFEGLENDFRTKFGGNLDECTTLEDFVIGGNYTSWDLGIFARTYNNLGGIYLVGTKQKLNAIFIKATLKEGEYQNEWLEPKRRLKYYLKGSKKKNSDVKIFNEEHKQNAAIIHSKGTPIFVFEKEGTKLTLVGTFSYVRHVMEPSEAKWFELEKRALFEQPGTFLQEELDKELQEEISKSSQLTKDQRQKRLAEKAKNPKKPRTRLSIITVRERDPDVIAEALERAAGRCEWCEELAPFLRRSDNTPFLEVHHLQPLAEDGQDTLKNARALCPNCHRKAHFGSIPNPFLNP